MFNSRLVAPTADYDMPDAWFWSDRFIEAGAALAPAAGGIRDGEEVRRIACGVACGIVEAMSQQPAEFVLVSIREHHFFLRSAQRAWASLSLIPVAVRECTRRFGSSYRTHTVAVQLLLAEPLRPMEHWTEKEQTQAEVRVFILDRLCEALPNPPYSPEETQRVADEVYNYIWERSAAGHPLEPVTAA